MLVLVIVTWLVSRDHWPITNWLIDRWAKNAATRRAWQAEVDRRQDPQYWLDIAKTVERQEES